MPLNLTALFFLVIQQPILEQNQKSDTYTSEVQQLNIKQMIIE